MGDRYQLVEGSISGHCCFEFTIFDTNEPEMYGDEHYKDSKGRFHYKNICECFDLESATMILKTLNAA